MRKQFSLVGAALAVALTLTAQSKDTLKSSVLNEVTITGNKTPQKQNQTGKVLSVINKDLLDKSAGRTLGQLLNEQAGITINGALNNLGTNQGVYVRGAGIGRTLILIDGIPVYDPSFINNEQDLNLLPLLQVQRVEIARGAQSTVYGSDAIAGVINVITTPEGKPVPIAANATLGYGSFNTWRAQAGINGQSDKWQYQAAYGKIKSDGFSAAADEKGAGNFDKDGYKSDSWRASVGYQFSKRLNAKAYGQYTEYRTDLDNGVFTDDNDFTNTNKSLLTGTTFTYQGEGFKVVANYMYSQNKRFYLDDSSDAPGFAKFTENDFFGKNHFAELYSNINLTKGLQLLAGIDYRRSSMNSRFFSLSGFGPYQDDFADTSVYQFSSYASLLFQYKGLHLEAGYRYTQHERYGGNGTFTFNPSYAFNNHFRLFGSVASGFKAPSIYQLYTPFTGNTALKPETGITYELGLQQSHEKFGNRIAAFYRDIDNGIGYDNTLYQYFNIAGQKVKGVEWESVYRPTTAVSLTLNYTYLTGKEETQSRINFKDTTYNYLLRRPKHQANATAGFQLSKTIFASLSGTYRSQRYDVGGYAVKDVTLGDYFLLGAYAEWKVQRNIKLYVQFQNLLNTTFYDLRGFNSTPFAVQGGVALNF